MWRPLRPNQTAIFYLLGDDVKRLWHQPPARRVQVARHRGAVAARSGGRLLGVGPRTGFEGKPFKSVTQGAADIKLVPLADGAEEPASADVGPEVGTLLAFMKQTLSEAVEDVRASDRLSESPACLIAPEFRA